MPHHDLVIIGSGSGNSLLTPELEGLDVAIVEMGTFGGTCLNVGCIPTKMFVLPADRVVEAEDAHRLGVTFEPPVVDWPAIRDRIFGRIDPISRGGEQYRRGQDDVTLHRSRARFTGPRRLVLDSGEEVTADRFVVAAGSRAVGLPVDGLTEPDPERGIHTSDTVMRMEALPARMAVLGGGFVACEMAHVFAGLGVHVTQVQRSGRLLMAEEYEVSERYTEVARRRYDVRLSTIVTAAERVGGVWRLETEGPEGHAHVEAEAVLVAVGRRPNTDLLDAVDGGLETHPDGRLVVDAQLRTTVPGVWALGDICSEHQLKHVANGEARRVAHNLAVDLERVPGPPREDDGRPVPHAVFGHPQVGCLRPHGGPAPCRRNRVRHLHPGRRRRRLRLGAGGHHGPAHRPRRAGRPHPRRPRARPPGVDAPPAAHPGGVLRAARARRRTRPVLDPPGPVRGRRERAARPPALTAEVPAYGMSVLAKICQASTDFATRLRITYCRSPKR